MDGAKKLGGLCILKGCMPSKTLIYSAEVLHLARTGKGAAGFGLRVSGATADMKAMHARKLKRIITEFAQDRAKHARVGKIRPYPVHARFVDSRHTIELDDGRLIRSKHFLIGTGSRVCEPPVPGLAAQSSGPATTSSS